MGLDISKIQNAELQKLAYKADADNNGMLNAEELSVFKAEALEKEGVSAEDFNQAMGLYKSAAATARTTAATKKVKETEENSPETSFVSQGSATENIAKNIHDFIKKGYTLEKILNKLDKMYTSTDYTSTVASIKEVITAIQDTKYNSKEDVETLKKIVETVINAQRYYGAGNDKAIERGLTRFRKGLNEEQLKVLDSVLNAKDLAATVLTDLVTAVENEQIGKETEDLIRIYNRIKEDPSQPIYKKNKNGEKVISFKELEKAVKKEMKKEGLKKESYYSDKAFEGLKNYIQEDANAIQKANSKKSDGVTEKEIKKNDKKTRAPKDPYARKASRQGKDTNKLIARHNNYEENYKKLKNVSADTLKSELSESTLAKLSASYFKEHRNEDGTYDVTSLAAQLKYRAGYDYMMNQSDNTQSSELRNIQAELKDITHGQEFTKSEVEELLKFCKIEKEGNKRAVLDAIKYALAGAVGSPTVIQHQRVRFEVEDAMVETLLDSLKEYGTSATTTALGDGQALITIEQLQIADVKVLSALAGLGVGVLGSILTQMILGEGREFEISCIPISDFDFSNERYTNFEEYEKYIKERYEDNGNKANAIITIAKLCKDENGKFDPQKYDSIIKNLAGVGSNANCTEVQGGLMYNEEILDKINPNTPNTPEVKPDENCGKDDKVCNAVVTKEETEATEKTEDLTKIHKTTYGDTWQGLVEAYYPDLIEKCGGLWGKNGAIRALKEALAGGDKDVLKKLLEGGNLPNTIKLPASINGVERQDGTVKKQKVHGNGKSLIKEVGKDDVRVTKIPGTTTYKAVDGCDEKVAPAYGSSAEEATANLEKQTGKKYDKIIEQ